MTSPSAGPADPARVRQYLDIFAYCLDECASSRGGPHEVFLWNARRLGEAMLYALAEGTPWAAQPKPLQGRPMDLADLQRKLVSQGLIPSRLLGNLDTLRHCGNVAPLPQGPDTVAETSTLDATRRAMVNIARWLYSESALQEPMPQAVVDALRDLESDQPRTPRQHRTDMELRRLRRELQLASAGFTGPGASAPSAGSETTAAASTPNYRVRMAGAAAAALLIGAALGWSLGSREPSQAPAPKPAPVQAAATPPRAVPVAAAVAVAQAAPPADAPSTTDTAAQNQATAATTASAEAEPAQPSEAAIGAAEPGEDAGATARSKSPPLDGECPKGALLLAERRLDLVQGPSPRPAWPQPAPDPPAQTVPAFCMDREAVSAGAFGRWLAGRSEQERQNYLQRKGNAAVAGTEQWPVHRVSWAEAQAYCRDRAGELPGILQWESALRSAKAPVLAAAMGEWAADAFPPGAFGYPKAAKPSQVMYFKEHLGGQANSRKPLLSWQRGAGRLGSPAVSFRCVWPVGSAKEGQR